VRVFCYKCKECGHRYEVPSPQADVKCGNGHAVVQCVRDYRAEGVSVDAAVGAINRDFASDERRNLFLPTRKDFERTAKSEREVDAKIKEWNERHDNPAKGSGKYRPK
jgi:hypothetical protein